MIYIFDKMESITEEFINDFLPCLPFERRKKALRYKNTIDRNLCVIGYWLLSLGLRREYNIFEYPEFSYNKNGKPYLANFPDVFFNISHCEEGVACVISQRETGIDIQNVRPYNHSVAKRVCTEEEMTRLERSPCPERLFCEFWTIKEGFIKLMGEGLAYLDNQRSVREFIDKAPEDVFTYWGERYHICCFGGGSDIIFAEPEALQY